MPPRGSEWDFLSRSNIYGVNLGLNLNIGPPQNEFWGNAPCVDRLASPAQGSGSLHGGQNRRREPPQRHWRWRCPPAVLVARFVNKSGENDVPRPPSPAESEYVIHLT